MRGLSLKKILITGLLLLGIVFTVNSQIASIGVGVGSDPVTDSIIIGSDTNRQMRATFHLNLGFMNNMSLFIEGGQSYSVWEYYYLNDGNSYSDWSGPYSSKTIVTDKGLQYGYQDTFKLDLLFGYEIESINFSLGPCFFIPMNNILARDAEQYTPDANYSEPDVAVYKSYVKNNWYNNSLAIHGKISVKGQIGRFYCIGNLNYLTQKFPTQWLDIEDALFFSFNMGIDLIK